MCRQELTDPNRNPHNVPHCGLVAVVQQQQQPSDRIIGGQNAGRHSHPWTVSFHDSYADHRPDVPNERDLHFCTGTIINDRFILTAAHCFDRNPNRKFRIMVGSNMLMYNNPETAVYTAESHQITGTTETRYWIHMHQQFDPRWSHWDIALVKLDRPLVFNISQEDKQFVVNAACLPGPDNYRPREHITLAAWGLTDRLDPGSTPFYLQEIQSLVITDDMCRQIEDQTKAIEALAASVQPSKRQQQQLPTTGADTTTPRYKFHPDSQFCALSSQAPGVAGMAGVVYDPATYRGPYRGDSGGGYIEYQQIANNANNNRRAVLCGIVSGGDADLINPSVRLTQVSKFNQWLTESMKLDIHSVHNVIDIRN
ncbi:serine proteinase stubble-like [Oppia nitens]|uniref:serine proteinase stubble-like n=1 Tax=Oppia nitens TaxID=1686743 RepID=UPI0023DA6AC6|nr:serine proteinase stubble-like [Oppia nitens]